MKKTILFITVLLTACSLPSFTHADRPRVQTNVAGTERAIFTPSFGRFSGSATPVIEPTVQPTLDETCTTVSANEFIRRAVAGSSDFVVTADKLGFGDYWTLREDVVLTETRGADAEELAHHIISRGFEFRYDLSFDPNDDWQEFHTTINVYDSAEYAIGRAQLFDGELASFFVPCAGPIYIGQSNDPDRTAWAKFVLGQYTVGLKTKFMDYNQAIVYLETMARIVAEELTDVEQ